MTNAHEALASVCETWETDGITYREMCRQDYANIFFSAGAMDAEPTVPGHERNSVFLRWGRLDDPEAGGMLHLTRDELAAIAWVSNGALWSTLLDEEEEKLCSNSGAN